MSVIDQNATTEPPHSEGPALECVGRYTLKELIGAGGMGRVYAADDPELGRTVAVKLIRSERPSPQARARLLREAQALARVRHPNVVTVHDAGTEGDTVFVAMELVDAPNAAVWLADKPRTWREILAAYIAAGRGLAAAHAKGIVHRDFKPENMLVGDDRVVVVDFGLARAGGEVEEASTSADHLVDVSLTMTGERVGTPLYMSPEQRAGELITAQSDQYSFCVALWSALHGAPPPEAGSQPVPAWIDRALKRGLAEQPNDRWPGMNALLQALGRDPVKRRRQIALVVGLLVAGAGVSAAAMRGQDDPCANPAQRLVGVWDAARQDALAAAFGSSNAKNAADAWRQARTKLDAFASRWRDMYVDACRAGREGRQSKDITRLRTACLEHHRSQLLALGDEWLTGVSPVAAANAEIAASGMGTMSDCSDPTSLSEYGLPPANPLLDVQVARARERLRAIQAMRFAYKLAEAKVALASVSAEVKKIGWPPLTVEVAANLAALRSESGERHAEEWLEVARLALAANQNRIAAFALVQLTATYAIDDKTLDRVSDLATLAESVIQGSGGDPQMLVQVQRSRGDALRNLGKFVEARAAFIAAYDTAVSKIGKSSLEADYARLSLTDVLYMVGDAAEARRVGEENLALIIEGYGPTYPLVANQQNALGSAMMALGENERARELYVQAADGFAKNYGAESPAVGIDLGNLAVTEIVLDRFDDAEKHLEHATKIVAATLGPEGAYMAGVLESVAALRRKQGRYADARAAAEHAIAIRQKAQGPAHPDLAGSLGERALEQLVQGDGAGALAFTTQVLAIQTKSLVADHPSTLLSRIRLGAAQQMLHRCADALPSLATTNARLEKLGVNGELALSEGLRTRAACLLDLAQPTETVEMLKRSLAILDKTKAAPIDHGGARWQLARALEATGDHAGAIATAKIADTELAGDADGAHDRGEVQAFLKKNAN